MFVFKFFHGLYFRNPILSDIPVTEKLAKVFGMPFLVNSPFSPPCFTDGNHFAGRQAK